MPYQKVNEGQSRRQQAHVEFVLRLAKQRCPVGAGLTALPTLPARGQAPAYVICGSVNVFEAPQTFRKNHARRKPTQLHLRRRRLDCAASSS